MARRVLFQQAQKSHIKIIDYVNVGNHLHLTIRLHNRAGFKRFSRAVTGLIARQALGKERGPSKPEPIGHMNENSEVTKLRSNSEPGNARKKAPFWDHRPFTRIVTWGRDLKALMRYLEKNRKQSLFVMQELYRSGDEEFSSA